MKKLILLAVAVAALMVPAVASAQWVPGTPYLVTENDATSFLENAFDHAYCEGVPRFGHRGEFPDEEFVVFDCSLKLAVKKINCFDVRQKSVKGSRPGHFRLEPIFKSGDMHCF
jgi:hypothetical protein